jgi:diguanylate cyclase
LRAFALSAETCIRKSDWLARTIGDSFMIVLPETTAAGAHRAAQKLRALFAVHPLSTPSQPRGFTVSVEVTAVNGKHDADGAVQIEALLRTANSGRNGNRLLSHAQSDRDPLTDAGAPRVERNDLN